jgi:hypothetical protein
MLFHRNKIYTYVHIPCPLSSEIKSQYELDAAWQYPFYIAAKIRVNNNNWYLFAISFVFIFLLSVLH